MLDYTVLYCLSSQDFFGVITISSFEVVGSFMFSVFRDDVRLFDQNPFHMNHTFIHIRLWDSKRLIWQLQVTVTSAEEPNPTKEE